MSQNRLAARLRPFRRASIAVMAASVVATGLVSGLMMSSASAASPPDPVVPNFTTVASIAGSSQLNVPNSGPLTGLVNGETVTIVATATGSTAGSFFGMDARLCQSGATIQFQSDFNPTQGLNCVSSPISAQSDAFQTNNAAGNTPPNTTATINFRVGTGSEVVSDGGTPPTTNTITCNATSPCAIWLKESFSTAIVTQGFDFVHFDVTYAGTPTAPQTPSVTAGNNQVTVNWAAPASSGNAPITSYNVSLNPAGAPAQTVSGSTTSATFTGLTNFTTYTATITATNTAADGTTHFTSPAATATGQPSPPPPTGLNATPANQSALLSWTAPAGPAPSGYSVTIQQVLPAGAPIGPTLTGSTATSFNATGLTNGTGYTFTVAAVYGANTGASSAPSAVFVPQGKFLSQPITVTRPQGALVLTQVCGNHGPVAADPAVPNWWPGSPALPAVTNGTAPNLTPGPGGPDPLFNQYPYPVDANGNSTANYPTACGIALGTARFITSGPGAGQYFQAKGLLSQVTVVDTRDTDPGWTASGQMGAFNAGTGKSFSGNQLGWTPIVTSTTGSFTDGSGNTYTQTVAPGPAVAPGANGTGGLGGGSPLGSAAAAHLTGTSTTGGLGIAVFDAGLKLLIPVFAFSGTYTGTLTLTAA